MVTKSTENAGIPLYATSFTTPDIIVSGGGGGQGAHGVKNKLVVYKLSGTSLAKTSEFLFPENSDSPTSLAANAEGAVWVGANAPPGAKGNQHLQKFATDEEGRIQWCEARDAFKSSDPATYQRATAAAGTTVAAASSEVPGKVVVIGGGTGDAAELDFDYEINTVALSEYDDKERRFVAAVGDQVVEFRNVNSPSHKWARVTAPQGHKWTRAAFTAPNTLIVASTIGQRKGVQLTRITIGESEVQATTAVAKVPRIAGVTAMAACGERLAVASPGGDIIVYDVSAKSLSRTAVLQRVHAFPVTDVSVASDGSIVSVSMDGSIAVHSGLAKPRASLVATIGLVLLSASVIAIFAILMNYQTMVRAAHFMGIPGPQLSSKMQSNEHLDYVQGSGVQDSLTPQVTSIAAVSASSEGYPHGTVAVESHILEDDTNTVGEASESTIQSLDAPPKVVEVPLHATPGHGHGPVVHATEPEAAPTRQPEPKETIDQDVSHVGESVETPVHHAEL